MDISMPVFEQALLDGDHGRALAIVKKWRLDASRFQVFRDLLTPAMYSIGLKWQQGDITVAEEHLATGVCDFILNQSEYELLSNSKSIDATPKAFFFSVKNEQHYLGLKMVSILFRERNWNVKFLQSDLPVVKVMEEVDRWRPGVIGLSFSLSYRAEELGDYLKALDERKDQMEVLVGGRLIHKYDFSSIGSLKTTFIKNLDDLHYWFTNQERAGRDNKDGTTTTSSII
ncbi:cobalamin B12-binding domain-containing protein [Alkalicoccus daliensis]|uniref:Methanogenic corrinoid protein MtbC1 n=1 Tax=Alkalicoccus daliensis TaxID=745820 RepID=A0A1H0AET5_9BACI|nr:B12-binding domain-containing protein [Alkalicoccus daliensis]SDN32128.1 Methanogenic corrinoid protein MtbC1 [Alkalicoccus daliensis]